MATKRPYSRKLIRLSILIVLFIGLPYSSVQAEGFFPSFSKRKLLTKPTSIVKGFFKSFKPFQDFPNFNEANQITQDDLLMQQAFNSPPTIMPIGSNNGMPPISEYLVSNFARLNPANIRQLAGLNNQPAFKKDQMTLSESITRSNVFYPNNMQPSQMSPINHNMMFDQAQKIGQQPFVDADGDYPAQQSQVSNYHVKEPSSSGPSISIGAAEGGGIGLKLGKFQMTFRRGIDGPQIKLGTHEEEREDQDAEHSNNYVSTARSKDKKNKGMNIKLGRAVQFSIGGNQDGDDKTGGSPKNVISLDTNRLKDHILPRKSSNLMSSASENSYDESPGIQMPAITIGGGNGNGRPAITIGGGGDEEDGSSGARPAITIGGGGDSDQGGSNNNNNYNNPNNNQGGDHWGDHWNDHKRPRIRMKMPDFPQTYIEKNLKLPPVKLKINAAPRVKITTGTKDPLEKKKIEEDPEMEDIFRPPEPFNVTVPGKDKNETSENGANDGKGGTNGIGGNDMDLNNNNGKINPNLNQNPYSDPYYQQYLVKGNNYQAPEQIDFVPKQQFDEQQQYGQQKYFSYNQQQQSNYQNNYQSNYQKTKHYQYEDRIVGETKTPRRMPLPKRENLQRDSSNDVPIYNDQGYHRPNPPNYNTYHIDNANRYPPQSQQPMSSPMRHLSEQQPISQQQYPNSSPPINNYRSPQLPNQYSQPPAPYNGEPFNGPPPPNGPYDGPNHGSNHHGHYGPREKTKEQIEEENAIYLKSKDEFAEDRPQIILDLRPKISISHANATHPEEKKDPRHKNPFIKMLLNPEFVNHTTPGPEFDDDISAVGYNKHYFNHYDFNKYKNHQPGKYGINYVKRTTTDRPIDKNRKSLTTTESPDASDEDYPDETTTTTMATTTTTSSSSREEDDDTSTRSSTTRDPDDELENKTTEASSTSGSSTRKSTDSSEADDDDDDLGKKLTTTGKPGELTTFTASSLSTSSTTEDSVTKKLTTSKPAKKATTSTTKGPEDYEDYDFGFLKACKDGTRSRGPKGRRKCPGATSRSPSTDLEDDLTTPVTSAKSDEDEDSNEKIVRDKSKSEGAKVETKDDYFTQMMKMMRVEKNPPAKETKTSTTESNEDSTNSLESSKKPSTASPTTTQSSSTEDDDDDEEESLLSTTTNKSKIKGRNQTDKSEALQFTTEQSSLSSILTSKRSKATKATKPAENKIAGINISDYETEVTTITDKSMLLSLIRMVNDAREDIRRMRDHTTPCPQVGTSSTSPSISIGPSTTESSLINSNNMSSTVASRASTKEDEDDSDEEDEKKENPTSQEANEEPSTTVAKKSSPIATSTTESSTTEKDEEEDDDEATTKSPVNLTSSATTEKDEDEDDDEATTKSPVILTSSATTEKDENEDDDEATTKSPVILTTSISSTTTEKDKDEETSVSSTQQTTQIKNDSGKTIGTRISSSSKGTKQINRKTVKSFSTFQTSKMSTTVSTTESSFVVSVQERSTSEVNNLKEVTQSDDKIPIETQLDLEDGEFDLLSNSTFNQPENAESKNNEPIIVVLLPDEEKE